MRHKENVYIKNPSSTCRLTAAILSSFHSTTAGLYAHEINKNKKE